MTLYERAIRNYFLVAELWLAYARYVRAHAPDRVREVLARALRNVPFSAAIWCVCPWLGQRSCSQGHESPE